MVSRPLNHGAFRGELHFMEEENRHSGKGGFNPPPHSRFQRQARFLAILFL